MSHTPTEPTANSSIAPEAAAPRKASLIRTLIVFAAALALALIGGLIAGIHDGWIAHREITMQNYLAPVVVALLLGPVTMINVLLRMVSKRLSLTAAEFALLACLALAATPLTRSGAWVWVSTVGNTNALRDAGHTSVSKLRTYNPYQALPQGTMLELDESRQFDQGLATQHQSVSLINPTQIPWSVWIKPALNWAPLMICFVLLAISLGVVLHSHWANRELLTFPLAQLTSQMLPDTDRGWPRVLRSPVFWAGFVVAGGIFLINGINAHEEKMIEIPTAFNYYSLSQKFPFLAHSLEGYSLLRGTVFFAILAAAVLLPAEISLSAWFFWPLMIISTFIYYKNTGQRFTGSEANMVQIGASLGMIATIVYSGRNFYLTLLRQAFFLGGSKLATLARERVYARLAIACAAGVTGCLIWWGVPWDLAILWTLASIIFMVVVARLTAEMGIYWTPLIGIGPLSSLTMVFGQQGLGLTAYALLAIITTVLLPSPVAATIVTPAVAHGLEIERKTAPHRLTPWVIAPFLLLALAGGIFIHIWLGYSVGGETNDYFSRLGNGQIDSVAQFVGATANAKTEVPVGERWTTDNSRDGTWSFIGFGAVLVIAITAMRLRFPRFPFHPLPLVVMGSWLLSRFWLSFFLGWLIKRVIIMIGGSHLFEKTKPFFVGLLAGQCALMAFWVLVNIGLYVNKGGISDPLWWNFLGSMFSF